MIPRTVGRYEVAAVLGQGGMGSVFRARDPRIGREVAIKLLSEAYDSELRDRFAREARSAGSLSHPNIVTIYDVGEHEGRPFIAMEYVAGQTFADLIQSQTPLPVSRKIQMMEEVCAGLAHAHESGIVHRDVKPANLMLDADGIVKILDFGIARLSTSNMTQAGAVMGTLNYMSPEQITGTTADRRADIFAVGAVLYELLSLHQAFPGQDYQAVFRLLLSGSPVPLAEYCPDLDPRLQRVIDQALEKTAARRFQTAESLQRELATIRLSLSVMAPRATAMPVGTPSPNETSMTSRSGEQSAPPTMLRPRTDPVPHVRPPAPQIESLLAVGDRAYDSGDYERAIESYEQVLLIDPAEPRAAAQIGRAHAAVDVRQARVWLAEARDHLSRGAIGSALDRLAAASQLSPDDPEVAALRARIDQERIDQERIDQERIEQERIEQERVRARGAAIRAVYERARAALTAGDLTTALSCAKQALALDPLDADTQHLKADIERAIARAEIDRLQLLAEGPVPEPAAPTGRRVDENGVAARADREQGVLSADVPVLSAGQPEGPSDDAGSLPAAGFALSIHAGGSWREYPLGEGETLVGRGPDCAVRLDDKSVSRNHARLVVRGDSITVIDLGSGNGTHYRGQPVTDREIVAGERLMFGTVEAMVTRAGLAAPAGDAPPARFPPESGSSKAAARPTTGQQAPWDSERDLKQHPDPGAQQAAGLDVALEAREAQDRDRRLSSPLLWAPWLGAVLAIGAVLYALIALKSC